MKCILIIIMKSHINRIKKPRNKPIYKRDLRESRIRHGKTITSFDWSEIYDLFDVNEKYNKFNRRQGSQINSGLRSNLNHLIIFSRIILVYHCKCCNLIGYSTRYLFFDR